MDKWKVDALAAAKEADPIEACIRDGKESKLLAWLRNEVHLVGRKMNAEDLVKKVTGLPLSSCAFLNYLNRKLELLNINT